MRCCITTLLLICYICLSLSTAAQDAVPGYSTVYWVRLDEATNSRDRYLHSQEILNLTINSLEPDIKISGKLILKDTRAASHCRVRLQADRLLAKSSSASITLLLRGVIGGQQLSTTAVRPTFTNGEAEFTVEGFIDSTSYQSGLPPGRYSFLDDFQLLVEFTEQ